MAGPAIRSWEYARVLSEFFPVTLAIPNESDRQPERFRLSSYRQVGLRSLAAQSDVLITSGYVLQAHPFLRDLAIPLVFSIPHSFALESLPAFADRGASLRWGIYEESLAVLTDQLLVGDFFVCNSERQRDYWLGMLSALGRVNPATYDDDPALRRLVDVVPFGLPDEQPQHRRQVLKGVRPGIAADDRVIYWGGGIYDWLDPLTLVRAMAMVREQCPKAKAFFAATRHPDPGVAPSRAVQETRRLSSELGLLDSCIIFNDWVPYEERPNYLLEADVGVSLHLDHIETRYAFRNRVLDYIWAGLPMVVTEGDVAAELVAQHGLGKVVGYRDAEGLAEALLELLSFPDLRARYGDRFPAVAARYRWSRAVAPLIEFCRAPRLAPDRDRRRLALAGRKRGWAAAWRMRIEKGWRCYREQGARALWREMRNYLRWRLG